MLRSDNTRRRVRIDKSWNPWNTTFCFFESYCYNPIIATSFNWITLMMMNQSAISWWQSFKRESTQSCFPDERDGELCRQACCWWAGQENVSFSFSFPLSLYCVQQSSLYSLWLWTQAPEGCREHGTAAILTNSFCWEWKMSYFYPDLFWGRPYFFFFFLIAIVQWENRHYIIDWFGFT